MKVGVCLKTVPTTDTRIRINAAANGIMTDDVKWEINTYDTFAVAEAAAMKVAKKATEVIIFTLGGAETEAQIRDGLARGADRAVRLDDPSFVGTDAATKARILAAAIQAEGCELVLTGRQAIDTDQSSTGPMIAEILGWRQATWVDKLEIDAGSFTADRAAGGGVRERVKGSLPAVITCDKGLNKAPAPSLPNIMAAKKKPIVVKNAAALGLAVGGNMVTESNYALPPARPPGRMLKGDNATVVKELVRLLREEAKVI